jgi:hypothetical protein
MKHTPFWPDGCDHPPASFVGNIVVRHSPKSNTYGDVYVFEGTEGQEICIRDGEDAAAYRSPGSLLDMTMHACTNSVYKEALRLIRQTCLISIRLSDDGVPEADDRISEAHEEV